MDNIELPFDPASEYQVLEEFEFDELIERPSAIRFFTFDEQVVDFVQKLLPKTGKVAKGIIRKAEHEVDEFTYLYKSILEETTDGYIQKEYKAPEILPWVQYTNIGEVKETTFNWDDFRLTQTELGPNYYFRMLDSLPKSALFYTEGEVPIYDNGKTKINDRIFLDDYVYTSTVFREDGSYKIQRVPRVDTKDSAKYTGYKVNKPPLDPPNPLTDHPFLSAHLEPIRLDTTERLSEILPNMETIFEHAIPETSDPYKEGLRYLKVYNIRLKDVPIKLWLTKFPPVPLIETSPSVLGINFSEITEEQPAKQLLDTYKNSWYPGLSSRYWLSKQEDGGLLVSRMLLSKVGDLGIVAIPPPVEFPESRIIEGTPQDCLPSEITGFDDFLTRGIYRAPKCSMCKAVGHPGTSCPIQKSKTESYLSGHGCIPLSFVSVERETAIYVGKQPWTPGTNEKILKEHILEIEKHRNYHTEYFTKPPASNPASLLSETRQLILKILDDDMKLPEDKLSEIQDLLRKDDVSLENHLYKDSDGAFLICEHEIEILKGEFNKNPEEYLRKWTARVDGFYVCQYSGDRIAEIIQDQVQFDEQGRVINRTEKISGPGYLPKEHLSFAISLRNLQSLFNLGEPAEDIMYLLISLIQVLPDEEKLIPFISYVREESAKVKAKLGAKIKEKKNEVDLIFGMFGFNAFVVMLQTHIPQLIPRRSFGGRPLLLNGYPRDSGTDAPLVDSLLGALQQTFENYPSTFRGSSVVFLRTLLKDRKGVKKTIMSGLQKQFVPRFKDLLQHASDTLEAVSIGYTVTQAYQPPIFRPFKDVTYLSPQDSVVSIPETRYNCYTNLPWEIPTTSFSFRQPELSIAETLRPSKKATRVQIFERIVRSYTPTADEVRRRLRIKTPIATAIFKRIFDTEKPRTLQLILLQIFTLAALENPSEQVKNYMEEHRLKIESAYENPSLLRDYFKGILFEFLTIGLTPGLERAINQDIPIRSLLSTAAETRATIDKLGTAEREEFKTRLRRMPDAQREVTKQLIDLGLAPYLITKSDRESFMKELQAQVDIIEPPTDNPIVAPGQEVPPEDVPEEGLHDERDIGPQGEVPENDGKELEYDYGDYGDARARTSEGEEFVDAAAYDVEEDFGT
jgi:hypothetical protein